MLGQCWPTVYDVGPTLGQCIVFAGKRTNSAQIIMYVITVSPRINVHALIFEDSLIFRK